MSQGKHGGRRSLSQPVRIRVAHFQRWHPMYHTCSYVHSTQTHLRGGGSNRSAVRPSSVLYLRVLTASAVPARFFAPSFGRRFCFRHHSSGFTSTSERHPFDHRSTLMLLER